MKSKLQSRITVLLVDHHPLMLEGLRSCLQRQNRFEVVGEAASGPEAIRKTKALKPDVLVVDIDLPVMNGLETTAALLKTSPKVKVLMLTAHDDRGLLSEIIQSGARGYLSKNKSLAELPRALESLHRGDVVFPREALETLIVRHVSSRNFSIEASLRRISDREREVLSLVVEGLSNKEIADRLHISIRTVQKHRERIMQKLGVHKVTQLVKVAVSRRLVNTEKWAM